MQESVQIAYQKIAKTIKCRDFLWNGSSSCFSTCWPCLWQFTKGQIRRWPGMLSIMMLTQLWLPTALIVERDKVRIWRDYYRRHQQILFWGTAAKKSAHVFFSNLLFILIFQIFQIATLLGCIGFIIFQLGGEIKNAGFDCFQRWSIQTHFIYKQINGFNYWANFHISSRYSHPYPQEPEVCPSKDSLCDLLHPLLGVHPSQVELVCFALRKNSVAGSSSCGRKKNTTGT